MPYVHTNLIRAAYRGDMAHRHVAALSGFHRIQASPGYRAAAHYVAEQLTGAGLEVQVLGYQADGVTRFWSSPSFLEWSCESATLHLLASDPGSNPTLLCDFSAIPTSLVQRSISVEGEFEVVMPRGKGGIELADYEGLDVAGKVVLAKKRADLVAGVAVSQLGAAGVLFYGMEAGGRTELDLPDARQYSSFWWPGQAKPDAWGFVLTPRQGRALAARLEKGETVRVAASIDSKHYPGAIEVVEARLPGDAMAGGEEILLVSHLCHPQPGAHDNASGAAALIEAAATLARLVADGRLPAPRRGIRFIWPPEMTGTFAYLAEGSPSAGGVAEDAAPDGRGQWLAGLNLDMVGADQAQTGGQWELGDLPQAGASFADHLLASLREPFLENIRHTETVFSAGSDHYILSDPTVGIPTPIIIHWPDKFYHSSEDTPDKVNPDSLARSGALAAVYAYWLATAGAAEAEWLGHWMVSRFTTWAGRAAAEVVETVRGASTAAARQAAWAHYRRNNVFRTDRMAAALSQLVRIDPGMRDRVPAWSERVAAFAAEEERWAEAALDGLIRDEDDSGAPSGIMSSSDAPWKAEAARLIPHRIFPGPIDVALALQAYRPDLQPRLQALNEAFGRIAHDYEPVLQYWSDGQHTVAEIGELAWLELGREADEHTLAYFKLLAEAGLLRLDEDVDAHSADPQSGDPLSVGG